MNLLSAKLDWVVFACKKVATKCRRSFPSLSLSTSDHTSVPHNILTCEGLCRSSVTYQLVFGILKPWDWCRKECCREVWNLSNWAVPRWRCYPNQFLAKSLHSADMIALNTQSKTFSSLKSKFQNLQGKVIFPNCPRWFLVLKDALGLLKPLLAICPPLPNLSYWLVYLEVFRLNQKNMACLKFWKK